MIMEDRFAYLDFQLIADSWYHYASPIFNEGRSLCHYHPGTAGSGYKTARNRKGKIICNHCKEEAPQLVIDIALLIDIKHPLNQHDEEKDSEKNR